jgi:hypothetical protein
MSKAAAITVAPAAPQAVAPVSSDDPILALIERAARDQSVDIDKMERLFGMHERMKAKQAEEAYNAAMAAAQAALIPVVKNRKNDNTGKRYADLLAIADQALPVVYANGFAVSVSECESPTKRQGYIGAACEVSHAKGHGKRYVFDIPIDDVGLKGNSNKTAIQAYGSTLTYARRYAVCNIFNIAVSDGDGSAPAPADKGLISAEQLARLEKLMAAHGVSVPDFCNHYEIGRVADVPARYFDKVIEAITSPKRKQSGSVE